MNAYSAELTVPPSMPVLKALTWIVPSAVDDADERWTRPGSELVAITRTRSAATKMPVPPEGVQVSITVVEAVSAAAAVAQYPAVARVSCVPVWPTLNEVAVVDALVVIASVVAPVTSSVLCVEMAPAEVVVALPPTVKLPLAYNAVVVALPEENVPCVAKAPVEAVVVALPLTVKLPLAYNAVVVALPEESVPAVTMLVLMVVAACAMPALTNTTASEMITVRLTFPKLSRYALIRFMMG